MTVLSQTDPLLFSHCLPGNHTFYPSGFGVELATDSPAVVAAASGVWGKYPKLFNVPPVRLRIAVSENHAEAPPQPAIPRGQENLVSIIHGSENFGVADLARGFAFVCLTSDVAHDPAYTVHYFLEPLAWVLLAARHVSILHAACVALSGRAVLLAGVSGSGKTCLSYTCARRGWTFLSGDAVQFVRGSSSSTVLGRPYSIRFREEARGLFPELRRYIARRGFNGKLDIEPPVEELDIATSVQAHADHIVFLKRSAAARQASLGPVSRQEAFDHLAQAIVFGDREFRQEQREALRHFVEGRQTLSLTYSDLDGAECLLRSLVSGTGACGGR